MIVLGVLGVSLSSIFCEIFHGTLGGHRRLAAFLFGELPGALLIGGGTLILGGVLCYTYLEAAK